MVDFPANIEYNRWVNSGSLYGQLKLYKAYNRSALYSPRLQCVSVSLSGCVILAVVARGNQEVAFTQPLREKYALLLGPSDMSFFYKYIRSYEHA